MLSFSFSATFPRMPSFLCCILVRQKECVGMSNTALTEQQGLSVTHSMWQVAWGWAHICSPPFPSSLHSDHICSLKVKVSSSTQFIKFIVQVQSRRPLLEGWPGATCMWRLSEALFSCWWVIVVEGHLYILILRDWHDYLMLPAALGGSWSNHCYHTPV